MCLAATSKVKIAWKPIVVWKGVVPQSADRAHASERWRFTYKAGRTHHTSILNWFCFLIYWALQLTCDEVNEGFHSWKNQIYYDKSRTIVAAFPFTIPRFSFYVEGNQYNNSPGFVSTSIKAPPSFSVVLGQ